MSRNPHRTGTRQLRRIHRLQQQGRQTRADKGLQRMLIHRPGHPLVCFELGLRHETQPGLGLKWYQRCVYTHPRLANAWYRMGLLYEKNADFLKAAVAFGTCLSLHRDKAATHLYIHLAQSLDQLKHEGAALHYYLKALEQEPDNPSVFFLMAQILVKLGDLDLAMESLMTLGRIYPARLDIVALMMGHQLEKQGEIAAARQCYAEAVNRQPRHWLWQLKHDVAFALVPDSRESIEAAGQTITDALSRARERLRQQTMQLPQEQFLTLSMLHGDIAYTAYHHTAPLQQRQLLADVISTAIPKPSPWQPRIRGKRLHLGILIAPRSLSLGYIYATAMACQLNPEDFEITLFCLSPDMLYDYIPNGRLHFGGRPLRRQLVAKDSYEAVRQIRAAQLDAIFFTEPGWDFHQYLLALFRVAPVQFTSWMNPGTSGLPTMDYYLSSQWIEPPDAEAEYSETLERWPTFPSWIPQIHFPPQVPRADFGLEPGWHIYGCLQNLLKFHPDFDLVLAEILRKDPLGHLIMVTPQARSRLASLLMKRFEARIPDVMKRIWVFPELDNQTFLQLLNHCDVVLDPLYYGSGTTAYQSLAAGLPMVTLPGKRMVGRITAGLCQSIGICDGIVESQDAYVERALALAQDAAWRADIRQRTLAAVAPLFEDPQAVSCLSEFLQRAVNKACG